MLRRIVNVTTTVLFSCVLVLMGIFIFRSSYIRFWETLKDFGRSIAYYFCEIFGIPHSITPTVNDFSQGVDITVPLPDDFDGFKTNALLYFKLLIDKGNFYGWTSHIAGVMTEIMKFSIIIIPCLIGLWFYIKRLY